MDGIHDLGGFQGFGLVEVEVDEPLFRSEWERRIFRLVMAAMLSGQLGGKLRYAVERIDPETYLTSSYYERWLTGVATVLVEAGVLDRGDLDGRLRQTFPLAGPIRGPILADPGRSSEQPRFSVGDRVVVREWHPLGHTRAPRYVRGKRGTIVRFDGAFSLPDVEMHCAERRIEPTYSIRFEAIELWGDTGDPVHVDLWESYLEDLGD
jgi:nitrile hydratase subunit beta